MKNKKLIVAMISGCLVIFLLLGLVGGSFSAYKFWYLPKISQDYIDATEKDYIEITELVEDLEDNVKNHFGPSSSSESIEDMKSEINDSIELAEKVISASEKNISNLPSEPSTVNGLNSSLKTYYENSKVLSEEYKALFNFMKKIFPWLEELQEVTAPLENFNFEEADDIRKIIRLYSQEANELEQSRTDLKKLETVPEVEGIVKSMDELVEAMITFINDSKTIMEDLLEIYETGNFSNFDILDARMNSVLSELTEAIEEFDEKNQNIDQTIKDKYLGKIEELDETSSEIEDQYKSLKEEYGLK